MRFYDAAYLRRLVAMPDVELVAVQDTDAGPVAKRAGEAGNPATFTDDRPSRLRPCARAAPPDGWNCP
jgi:hypothetical protein